MFDRLNSTSQRWNWRRSTAPPTHTSRKVASPTGRGGECDGPLSSPRTTPPRGYPRPGSRERSPNMGTASPTKWDRQSRVDRGRLEQGDRQAQRLRKHTQHPRAKRGELGPERSTLTSITAYGEGITSRSSHNTGQDGNHASRTVGAAKSPTSTKTGRSRSTSTGQNVSYGSRATMPSLCGSPTPSTSTASRARPSIAPSCSPAAGKQARRPPTSKPPAPATAPTGTSPATNSAKKVKTPTGSHNSRRMTQKPSTHHISKPPGAIRPRVEPHPRPARSESAVSACGESHTVAFSGRTRSGDTGRGR